MKSNKRPRWKRLLQKFSGLSFINLNTAFFLIGLFLIGGFFILNWIFINTLRHKYQVVTEKEARLYAAAISSNLHISELNWAFAEILQKSEFPVIITNKYNIPMNWKNIRPGIFSGIKEDLNTEQNFQELTIKTQNFLRQEAAAFDKYHQPIELMNDRESLGHLHYGDVWIISLLSLMPLLEFLVLLLFLFIGYTGYHIIGSGERNLLWVALAKETAHQMGTPLSSLMGWMEYLKHKASDTPLSAKIEEILHEMNSDISRLTRVSVRFSQIGSVPKLEINDINILIRSTMAYFEHRLPQIGKKVDLKTELKTLPKIQINNELIGWVLENLIKNSLDSIEKKKGFIKIKSFYVENDKAVHITINDNGRGIEKENWKKVFQTGYSTKNRGWGLGLSLAQRIINIYHKGNIYIENSSAEGTQFRIVLPVLQETAKKDLNDKQ